MATKYNRQELLFLWVAGGHTEASFTDAVYKYLTAAQGGPPEPAPTPAPRPVSVRVQPKSTPRPAPKPASKPAAAKPAPTRGGLGTVAQGKLQPPVEVKQWSPVLIEAPSPPPREAGSTFTPLPVIEHGPFAGADVPFNEDAVTTEYGQNIVTVLGVGFKKGANDLAILAALCLGFGENGWHTYGCNKSDHCGVFQLNSDWQKMHSYTDVAYWAAYAYDQGFYGYGGIIHISLTHPTWSPGEVTQACQGAGPTFAAAAYYYNTQLPSARTALATYGPIAKKGYKYTAAAAPSLPYSNSNRGASLLRQIKAVNYAGNIANVFKYIRGGSNEAAHMSQVLKGEIVKTDYVKPS